MTCEKQSKVWFAQTTLLLASQSKSLLLLPWPLLWAPVLGLIVAAGHAVTHVQRDPSSRKRACCCLAIQHTWHRLRCNPSRWLLLHWVLQLGLTRLQPPARAEGTLRWC